VNCSADFNGSQVGSLHRTYPLIFVTLRQILASRARKQHFVNDNMGIYMLTIGTLMNNVDREVAPYIVQTFTTNPCEDLGVRIVR
jgi:hypothetical protein